MDPKDNKPDAKVGVLVESVRENALRKARGVEIFYIKLSNGKTLNTKSRVMHDLAHKLQKGKMPIAFKEEKGEGGHFWLTELKAA